jgi:signal transduction histidine kinase
MRDLRATVNLLRTPASEPADRLITSLAHLPALVENATASGLQFDVQIDGDVGALPAMVDAAAYRIIQEALTGDCGRNVGGGCVTVRD